MYQLAMLVRNKLYLIGFVRNNRKAPGKVLNKERICNICK